MLEWTPALPDNLKIKGKTTKYLLRQLSKQYIPAELVTQPKRGFEIPLKNWVNADLHDIVRDYLFSANAFNKAFIRPSFLKNVWDRQVIYGEEKRAKMLWSLFAMEVWYRKCYLS
jgi:asparagine synthase (glutamine-hydrolysing)